MINGINVISTNVIKELDFWTFLLITVIAGFLIVMGIALLKVSKEIENRIENKKYKIYWKIINTVLLVALFFFAVIGIEVKAINDCFLNPTYYTEYTVTISDKVSYNEFTERYKVIEYNEKDNTYVIREKENVD